MIKKLFSQSEGFTLMEMIVVLVIIGLLIAGGIGFYNGYIENSKITKAKSQISIMQGAMDSYYAEKGVYPSTEADQQLSGIDTSALDPWGKKYVISVASTEGGENNYYVISTGFAQVHQNKVVAGSGKWGRSQEPDVVDPS
jgi:general secretion pathway protein G